MNPRGDSSDAMARVPSPLWNCTGSVNPWFSTTTGCGPAAFGIVATP